MSYPATLLRAGAGRRGDLLPAPSPEISAAHTPVKRKLTGVVPPARVCSLARANSSASGPRLSHRSPAGAAGRNSHQPVSCGGTGCVLLSAAHFCHWHGARLHAGRPALTSEQHLNSCGGRSERLMLTAGHRKRPVARCARPGDETPRQPLSGGPSTCGRPRQLLSQVERLERRMGHPSAVAVDRKRAGSCLRHIAARPALTSSALTADPRRADPGNSLAGAVSVLRRLPNWPVALRGGGHIAGVV